MTGHQIQLFVDRSGTRVNWRLLAGNNRETGRGTRPFADEASCRAAIHRLQHGETVPVARPRRAPSNRWAWELVSDGTVIAASTHTFDRLIRCEQMLAVVVERVMTAAVAPCVVDMTDRRFAVQRTARMKESA